MLIASIITVYAFLQKRHRKTQIKKKKEKDKVDSKIAELKRRKDRIDNEIAELKRKRG
jgi:hypothetical protein